MILKDKAAKKATQMKSKMGKSNGRKSLMRSETRRMSIKVNKSRERPGVQKI